MSVQTMKRNVLIYAILFCIAIFILIASSEAQASGRILIRKAPGADAKIQAPNGPGFNSDWTEPDGKNQPVQMKFTVQPVRPCPVTPENPQEVRTKQDKNPHYEGSVALKHGEVLINVKVAGNKKQVMLPQPAGFCSRIPSEDIFIKKASDDVRSKRKPEEISYNGIVRRIVVWNGKTDQSGQQLMICSDTARSATGQKEAVLCITPLPGEPIKINRVSDDFETIEKELVRRINRPGNVANPTFPEWNGRITSYCTQAIKAENLEEFLCQAENMVSNLYGDTAQLQWQPMQLSQINLLMKVGYKWFAFDVSLMREWSTITEPIAYRTKSDCVKLPIFSDKIGVINGQYAVTNTIIITPQKVKLDESMTDLTAKDVVVLGNRIVEFTVEELERLSPDAAAFCKENKIDKVFVQQVFVESDKNEYSGDIVMKVVEQPVVNPSNPAGKNPSVPAANQNDGKKVGPNASGNAAAPQTPAATQPANANPSRERPRIQW